MAAYRILDEHGRPFTGRYDQLPRAQASQPAARPAPPLEESERWIQEGLRRLGCEPLSEAAAQDTVPLVERPSWAAVPRPKPKPSTQSSGSRAVELREPGDAKGSLREAFKRLGLSESEAAAAADGR